MSKEWVVLIDKNFLATHYLTVIEKMLYQALCYHARDGKECWPSLLTLSNYIQRSERQTKNILHSMLEKRVITWKAGFAGKSNNYTIWPYEPSISIFDDSKLAPKSIVREQLQRSKNISDSKKGKKKIVKFKVV